MTDQPVTNQPVLSPEEELDVLEAVYKIGKEKGLDLLRPEQIKKLTDAGIIDHDGNMILSNRVFEANSEKKVYYLRSIVEGLVESVFEDAEKITGKKIKQPRGVIDRNFIQEEMFKQIYGYYPDFFLSKLTSFFQRVRS